MKLSILITLAVLVSSSRAFAWDLNYKLNPIEIAAVRNAVFPFAEQDKGKMYIAPLTRTKIKGWSLWTYDPRSPEEPPNLDGYRVIYLGEESHDDVHRVAVRVPINAYSPTGEVRWWVAELRYLVEVNAQGDIVTEPYFTLWDVQFPGPEVYVFNHKVIEVGAEPH